MICIWINGIEDGLERFYIPAFSTLQILKEKYSPIPFIEDRLYYIRKIDPELKYYTRKMILN